MCPSRKNSLEIDTEISDFYNGYYPKTAISQVAWVKDFNNYQEVIGNDFGQSKYSQILIHQNKVLIATFAIAGSIAVLGAFLISYIVYILIGAAKQ